MNQHKDFARIGESPVQEAQSAPAIRLSLSDIVEEYETKAAAIKEAVAAFHEAETAIKTAACIQGTFGSDPFSQTHGFMNGTCAWRFCDPHGSTSTTG